MRDAPGPEEQADEIDAMLEDVSGTTADGDLAIVQAAAEHEDPGAAFEADTLAALRRLKANSPAHYERALWCLKRRKVSMRRLHALEDPERPGNGHARDDDGRWILTAQGRIQVCEANAARWLVRSGRARKMRWNSHTLSLEIGGRPLGDGDVAALVVAAQTEMIPSGRWDRTALELACAHLVQAAEIVTWHPIRAHLEALAWDGEERIATLAASTMRLRPRQDGDDGAYLGYATSVLRATLIACVARVLDPGCKSDHMLVLVGAQDIGKSTWVEILAGKDEWYMADLGGDLHSKDALMSMRGKWVVELAEMFRLGRAQSDIAKAFLSRRTDRYREPWGRHTIDAARQCVFIGTSNRGEVYDDPTGGRRYWPLEIDALDLDAWRACRDQVVAEAVAAYRAGETWWLDNGADKTMAKAIQVEHGAHDVWEEVIDDFTRNRLVAFTMGEVFDHMKIPIERQDRSAQTRVGAILAKFGHRRYQKRDGDTRRWVYSAKPAKSLEA